MNSIYFHVVALTSHRMQSLLCSTREVPDNVLKFLCTMQALVGLHELDDQRKCWSRLQFGLHQHNFAQLRRCATWSWTHRHRGQNQH
jgi:hypothetical protein